MFGSLPESPPSAAVDTVEPSQVPVNRLRSHMRGIRATPSSAWSATRSSTRDPPRFIRFGWSANVGRAVPRTGHVDSRGAHGEPRTIGQRRLPGFECNAPVEAGRVERGQPSRNRPRRRPAAQTPSPSGRIPSPRRTLTWQRSTPEAIGAQGGRTMERFSGHRSGRWGVCSGGPRRPFVTR